MHQLSLPRLVAVVARTVAEVEFVDVEIVVAEPLEKQFHSVADL